MKDLEEYMIIDGISFNYIEAVKFHEKLKKLRKKKLCSDKQKKKQ